MFVKQASFPNSIFIQFNPLLYQRYSIIMTNRIVKQIGRQTGYSLYLNAIMHYWYYIYNHAASDSSHKITDWGKKNSPCPAKFSLKKHCITWLKLCIMKCEWHEINVNTEFKMPSVCWKWWIMAKIFHKISFAKQSHTTTSCIVWSITPTLHVSSSVVELFTKINKWIH